MPTTTATTGPPSTAGTEEPAVRQQVSQPRQSLADCVKEQIRRLHDKGVRTIALSDFEETAQRAGRPLSWIGDHLIVLEGIGILRPAELSGGRVWTINARTEYLR